MATLTIRRGQQAQQAEFTAPARLMDVLSQSGVPLAHPCGGRGVCGKCSVMLSGCVSQPNSAEVRCGARLSCQAMLTGDAQVILPVPLDMAQIASGSRSHIEVPCPHPVYGAAIDIGTTTLALALYSMQDGACLASATMANPQGAVAADVIGRMDAALHGQAGLLREQIESALSALIARAAADAEIPANAVETLVVTGNTAMLYLLTGRDPLCLSRAPFEADHRFGETVQLFGKKAYLPHCLHAFVGADTACAILSSGMMDRDETALLCDVGTNGELALWHGGRLYIASTAAGPAFEGAGIRHGCASVAGAIDRCELIDGKLAAHTIGNQRAVGICGSGLLDAIACLLETQDIDESGLLEDDEIVLRDGVALIQQDIRAVQLAKAAICAGMLRLMQSAGAAPSDIRRVYLAGGFGSHLNIRSAVKVGLIPESLADQVQVIGNAALDGASMLLGSEALRGKTAAMQQAAQHIRLDGDAAFAEMYVENMLFGE